MFSKLSLTSLLISSLFIILSLQVASAQYDDLIDDPNISWLAEFTIDHQLSLPGDNSREIVKLIKLYNDPSSTEYANLSNWVIDWVYQSALDGDLDCYADPGLTQVLSNAEIASITSTIDTVTTFDPNTFEERIVIVKNMLNPEDIKSLRTNQVIYYEDKTTNFETRLIAIAPIVNAQSKPLFWVKMNEAVPNNFNIHKPEISWGALVYSKAHPLELNFMEVKKDKSNFDFRTRVYEQAANQEKRIEKATNYGSNSFLSADDILNQYNSIDTVITFDPDTYEETVQIIKNTLSPSEVPQYRLVQEWYYDNDNKKLMNRLKAIAPIVRVKDDLGNFRYTMPLYYIRYD